jgi:hypothetical protein
MKLLNSLSTATVAVAAVFAFSSCQKIIDKIFHGHGHEESGCIITQVKQPLEFSEDVRTGVVYNNAHGDPDSVVFDIETGSAGAHLFYFKYDDMHRLVEYSGWYSREADDYYFIHRYGYQGSQIVYDTTQWREAGSWTRMAELEYDAKGRVIKEASRDTLLDGVPGTSSEGPTETYTYNADDNLDGGTYDDKVSFLRTNEVWMFTQRNYSRNNPQGAIGYNSEDLPLGFAAGHGVSFLQFGGPSEIQYDCD